MSTASPHVKRFKPAVPSTPLFKTYIETKTKTPLSKQKHHNFFLQNILEKGFDKEKLMFNLPLLCDVV